VSARCPRRIGGYFELGDSATVKLTMSKTALPYIYLSAFLDSTLD
jgi:hypothetical protein